MKRVVLLAIGLILAVASLFTGCTSDHMTPFDVVKAAYNAANQGNYQLADSYLSASLKAALGNSQKGWDEITEKRTINKIIIMREKIEGDSATVHFRLRFKKGNEKELEERLTREQGEWKITINKNG